MAIKVENNIDYILRSLEKFGKAVEIQTRARRYMVSNMKRYKRKFAEATPVRTGAAKKSIKIKSRTKRGVTRIRMIWTATTATTIRDRRSKTSTRRNAKGFREEFREDVNLPYINVVNFNKNKNAKGAGFATDLFNQMKVQMDDENIASIRRAFIDVANENGIKVI